jgi:hypothetical protein
MMADNITGRDRMSDDDRKVIPFQPRRDAHNKQRVFGTLTEIVIEMDDAEREDFLRWMSEAIDQLRST